MKYTSLYTLNFSQKYKTATHICSTLISHYSVLIDDKIDYSINSTDRGLLEMCLVLTGLLHKRQMWLGDKVLLTTNKLKVKWYTSLFLVWTTEWLPHSVIWLRNIGFYFIKYSHLALFLANKRKIGLGKSSFYAYTSEYT